MEREFYNEMYVNEDVHWWHVARRLILQKVLDQSFQDKKPDRILEVGCGSGGNLQMLKEYGSIFAMELDDEARSMANKRNICNVKKGELPNNIPFENGFDLICMLDVLEHIDDDLAALQTLRSKLNQKGKIFITVPAYKFLWSDHDVASHHKRRYVKKQITNLVSKSGLKVKYSTYFNTFLFPVIASIRTIDSIFNKSSTSNVNLPSKFLNNLLIKIFSSEKVLLPKMSFPFGVSILLIAEKN
jgi:SAM-dependent methyltransferase